MRGNALMTVVAMAAFAVSVVFAADPYVGYVYPSGLQAGTTNRIIVGGQGFWGHMDAGVTGEGVEVLRVECMALSAPPTASQLKWMRKWLDGIIERGERTQPAIPTNAAARVNEWTVNAWWTTLDQLGRRELEAVERDVYIRKNQLQMTPSLRQLLFVDVAVSPSAKPGRRDFCVWTQNGISPPRPFLVSKARRIEEPLYTPPHRKPMPPPKVADSFPCILDGRIMPGETDRFRLILKQGEALHFNVIARELQPYIGDAVPGFFNAVLRLVGPDGKEVAFADDRARFLPDPELDFTAPTDGTYTLEIHDNLFRGREDFVYAIEIGTAPSKAVPSVPADSSASWWRYLNPFAGGDERDLEVGGEVAGTVRPGREDIYRVELEGPGAFIFDLRARREGSSLDGVLTLRDRNGSVVWRHDDVTNALFTSSVAQAECDAAGRVELAAGERRLYTLAVGDLTGHGGEGYGYRLRLRREQPWFRVYASRSAFIGRPWGRLPVTFRVERGGGFAGPITLIEGEDFRFDNGFIPAGTNELKTVFQGRHSGELPLRDIRIRALGEVGGVARLVDVIAADEYMQAFAWRHLLPARSFILKDLPGYTSRLNNLRPTETVVLTGEAADAELAAALRLYFDLKRPMRAPEVRTQLALPSPPLAKTDRYMMLTPFPYDQYGVRSSPNRRLNDPLFARSKAIRYEAARRAVALADLHDALTQFLRERPQLKLCGEGRNTPSKTMRWLALARICETMNESSEIATVRLNVKNGKEEVTNGRIRDVSVSPVGASFVYVPRAWPLPVTGDYRIADRVYPITQKLNREMFFVKGLKAGKYALGFDGREVGRFSASELEKGVNVAPLDTPNQRQAQAAAVTLSRANYRALGRPGPVRVTIEPTR